MRVIATAGHVDHGKSTLIRVLTGIDPDRLREERERGMTIDLGFAWLRLPDGEELGIVDVPGHQDFIRNMLAGVGGIDAVLLVVALDEGVMPQTREHLAILGLLAVERGLVALTKRDLVDDDWAGLVREETRGALARTPLRDAELVEVAASAGRGLDELQRALSRVLAASPAPRDLARPRLPIDRAFSMTGFGTVVTGTLRDGHLALGDEVEIVPGGKRARVRGLQTHRQKLERAVPGSRVAANLTGVDASELRRGMVLVPAGSLRASSVLAARVSVLEEASRPLEHDAAVKVYVGTAEVVARLSVLEGDAIAPGESAWAQLRLAEPVAAGVGDRFVLRVPSPAETIGGGVVADLTARRLRRRAETVAALERAGSGDLDQRILALLGAPLTRDELARGVDAPPGEVDAALARLRGADSIVDLAPFLLGRAPYGELAGRAARALASYHARYPLRRGMPREELRGALAAESKLWAPLVRRLVEDGAIAELGTALGLPDHAVRLPEGAERAWSAAREMLRAHASQPPSVSELGLDPEVVGALAERGELVRLAGELVLLPESVRRFGDAIIEEATAAGRVSVARARDLTGSSRKYVLPLLQFLDDVGALRRSGEERVLAVPPADAKARLARALTLRSEVAS